MQLLQNFIQNGFYQEYFIAAIVFVLTLFALYIFRALIVRRLRIISKRTANQLDDAMANILYSIRWPFYVLVALYLALRGTTIPDVVSRAVSYLLIIGVTYYTTRIVQSFIDAGVKTILSKTSDRYEKIDDSAVITLTHILKAILWIVAAVLLLSNLGFNVSTLIAGLGIGGLAIAFALQNILSDIFSSFSIYFDQPFKTGDFIVVDNDMGVVKHIGIKSTRLQTLQGEELVISNKQLTESRVHNFKKLQKRRIVFTFGVTYETPNDQLRKIPEIIAKICAQLRNVKLDRVNFKDFGDFSLNYEVVYYLESGDYNEYMNTQQSINLAIKEQLEQEEIEFAYPTQVLYIKK